MINELEKKSTMSKMSDLEHDKNAVEMMRYRDNKLSYGLGFGAIAFSVLAAFINLNSMCPKTIQVILCIILNIVILLFGFLSVERTKAYSKQGSIALIVLGGINIAQIFWLPLTIITTYNKWLSILNSGDAEAATKASTYARDNVGAVIYEGNTNSVHWLATNGNFRGILAIVFLGCGAALFIVAGIFGIKRSNKLNKYLDSLKVEKK